MTYITVSEVRGASGAPESLISDAQITEYIGFVENEMARWLNTAFVPTQMIEVFDGNNNPFLFTSKNPILSVRQLKINTTTTITPSYLVWSKPSGKVTLTNSAESSMFTQGIQNTFIKYLYGMLEESSVSTATTVASTVGTTISLTVSSISSFAADDWVEIYGMDGKREVAQISGTPSGSTIIVDQLVKTHESGSVVVKLQIPPFVQRYMLIEAAICAAINAIGATYVFNASYSLGELSVTKGVPYTHWQSSVEKLLKERNMRQSRIKPRPSVVVN